MGGTPPNRPFMIRATFRSVRSIRRRRAGAFERAHKEALRPLWSRQVGFHGTLNIRQKRFERQCYTPSGDLKIATAQDQPTGGIFLRVLATVEAFCLHRRRSRSPLDSIVRSPHHAAAGLRGSVDHARRALDRSLHLRRFGFRRFDPVGKPSLLLCDRGVGVPPVRSKIYLSDQLIHSFWNTGGRWCPLGQVSINGNVRNGHGVFLLALLLAAHTFFTVGRAAKILNFGSARRNCCFVDSPIGLSVGAKLIALPCSVCLPVP